MLGVVIRNIMFISWWQSSKFRRHPKMESSEIPKPSSMKESLQTDTRRDKFLASFPDQWNRQKFCRPIFGFASRNSVCNISTSIADHVWQDPKNTRRNEAAGETEMINQQISIPEKEEECSKFPAKCVKNLTTNLAQFQSGSKAHKAKGKKTIITYIYQALVISASFSNGWRPSSIPEMTGQTLNIWYRPTIFDISPRRIGSRMTKPHRL